jgi:hypothetical protein
MSLHIDCLVLEAEVATMQEAYRAYEACRRSGDVRGAAMRLLDVLSIAARSLELSHIVLEQVVAQWAQQAERSTEPPAT